MSDYRIILKAKDLDTKQNWVKKLREFMTERMQFIPKALKDKPAMLFKPSNIKPLQASKAHLLAFPNRCVKYNVLIMVHVMLWCNQVRTVKDLVNDIFLFWKLAVFSVHKVIYEVRVWYFKVNMEALLSWNIRKWFALVINVIFFVMQIHVHALQNTLNHIEDINACFCFQIWLFLVN